LFLAAEKAAREWLYKQRRRKFMTIRATVRNGNASVIL
jgi:hypothetical protein